MIRIVIQNTGLFILLIGSVFCCSPGNLTKHPNPAVIINTKVLCKEPGRYIGWPTITRTKAGELLVVFSGNRDAHICPFGITQLIRSQDNGVTWSSPATINNTPLDDRDAGILETGNGTWVLNWFTSLAFDHPSQYKAHPEWVRHAEKISEEMKKQWLGNWIRRSTDQGKTWEEPVKQVASSPHGPIELHNGRLLYLGIGTVEDQRQIVAEESADEGRTWKVISAVPIPKEIQIRDLSEPNALEVSKDTIITLVRYNSGDKASGYLFQTESTDGGKSWSILHQTPIYGFPAHMLKLKNGWILATYGVRKEPFGERACLSRDNGKTWDIDHEITINESSTADLGYPSSVQLEDGSIFTAYYQIDRPGEKTCLMGTRWKIR